VGRGKEAEDDEDTEEAERDYEDDEDDEEAEEGEQMVSGGPPALRACEPAKGRIR